MAGKFSCPICGDPNAYPLWIDDEPPLGCPEDMSWQNGGAPEIKDLCSYQKKKAAGEALRRKMAPHCFDENGNMKPGMAAEAFLLSQPK